MVEQLLKEIPITPNICNSTLFSLLGRSIFKNGDFSITNGQTHRSAPTTAEMTKLACCLVGVDDTNLYLPSRAKMRSARGYVDPRPQNPTPVISTVVERSPSFRPPKQLFNHCSPIVPLSFPY